MIRCPTLNSFVDKDPGFFNVIVLLGEAQIHALIKLVKSVWRSFWISEPEFGVSVPYSNDTQLVEQIQVLISHMIEAEHQRSWSHTEGLHCSNTRLNLSLHKFRARRLLRKIDV